MFLTVAHVKPQGGGITQPRVSTLGYMGTPAAKALSPESGEIMLNLI